MNVTYIAQDDQISSFVILITTFCFIIYWFVAQSQKIKEVFYAKHAFDEASRKHIFFTKYVGFLVLGLIPVLFLWLLIPSFSLKEIGLWFNSETTWFSIAWSLGLSLVVIPMAFISAKKPENLKNYPQIRSKVWTNKTMVINLLGWALYLFGYE